MAHSQSRGLKGLFIDGPVSRAACAAEIERDETLEGLFIDGSVEGSPLLRTGEERIKGGCILDSFGMGDC